MADTVLYIHKTPFNSTSDVFKYLKVTHWNSGCGCLVGNHVGKWYAPTMGPVVESLLCELSFFSFFLENNPSFTAGTIVLQKCIQLLEQ